MKWESRTGQKLARLLEHTASTPYYERLLGSNSPTSTPWERFADLPVVGRQERSRHPIEFVSKALAPDAASQSMLEQLLSGESTWENETKLELPNGRSIVLEKTSGSTGTPLKMVKTDLERMTAGKAVWRLRRTLDSTITPAAMFPFEHAPLAFEFPFDLGDYSPSNVGACLREIGRRGYTWLHGHPQGLDWWAEIVLENPEFRRHVRFQRIESNGSRLTESARRRIEAAFGCPVVDNYNCREVWTIGYECQSRTMHVAEDCVIAEVFGENGLPAKEGEFGSLVVTSLCALSMPFIRYELGDRLSSFRTECSCGRTGLAIRFPEHNANDVIGGHSVAGSEVFSKVTRFLYGSFPFQYEGIRVLEIDRGVFDVWIAGFRGKEDEFTGRFSRISTMLLEPLTVRFEWHFVEPSAPTFRKYPRTLFVSAAACLSEV